MDAQTENTLITQAGTIIAAGIGAIALVMSARISSGINPSRKATTEMESERALKAETAEPRARVSWPRKIGLTALLVFDLFVLTFWLYVSLRLISLPEPMNKDLALVLVAGVTMLSRMVQWR